MEKQFSITFDLSKIQVLIPSGRLMNLKEQLNWDDIGCSREEMNKLNAAVSAHDFNTTMDFSQQSESHVNKVMNDKYQLEVRKASYNECGMNQVLSVSNFAEKTSSLTEEFQGQLAEMFEAVKENEHVKKKLQKLAQLKLINN
jgi:outer membrane protein OmpA-like peptidoglycan-associated protein